MPADKNLVLLTNSNLTTTATTTFVDIGWGGTPVTAPLVARTFWGSAAATITLNTKVQAAYDYTNGPWRDLASGDVVAGPAATKQEASVRFLTRRRYVRAVLSGGAANQVTVTIDMAARSSPELDLL